MTTVLITTDYLVPGDEVDRYLTGHGFTTRHAPLRGPRRPGELVAALDGVAGALVANDPLPDDVLRTARQLRAIVRTGVGYDAIDVAAAARLGISVSNLPGINANAVAEYTIGLVIALARRLFPTAAGIAAGAWPRHDGHELRGRTLGLIGWGAAARAVAPLAAAFGLTVLCSTHIPEPHRFLLPTPAPVTSDRAADSVHAGDDDVATRAVVRFVELDELLCEADFVSIHTALTESTRHLIGAAALARMKPGAYLVNTARGPIVDEHALAAAVRAGRIAGAALDVVDVEPLPPDSVLRGVEGITVLSHLAGQTAEARRAAGLHGARELVAALAGRPSYAVHLVTEAT